MEQGNTGDSRGVGAGVMEMRIDFGPGIAFTTRLLSPRSFYFYVAVISARNGKTSDARLS